MEITPNSLSSCPLVSGCHLPLAQLRTKAISRGVQEMQSTGVYLPRHRAGQRRVENGGPRERISWRVARHCPQRRGEKGQRFAMLPEVNTHKPAEPYYHYCYHYYDCNNYYCYYYCTTSNTTSNNNSNFIERLLSHKHMLSACKVILCNPHDNYRKQVYDYPPLHREKK